MKPPLHSNYSKCGEIFFLKSAKKIEPTETFHLHSRGTEMTMEIWSEKSLHGHLYNFSFSYDNSIDFEKVLQ